MGINIKTKKSIFTNVDFTSAKFVHSHAAANKTAAQRNEKYKCGNLKIAKTTKGAKTEAVITRCSNIFLLL